LRGRPLRVRGSCAWRLQPDHGGHPARPTANLRLSLPLWGGSGGILFDRRLRGLFRRCPGPSFSAAGGSLESQRSRTLPHQRLCVWTCWREQ